MELKWVMTAIAIVVTIGIIGESFNLYNEQITAQKAMEKNYIQVPGPRNPYRTLWVKEVNEND